MESKPKLAASATCQGQGVHADESRMIDRISNLPDHVAHHVLLFLTIPHLARFGCVSKRCRELCLSTPSLNFDEFSIANESTCIKRQGLLNCLDRFFLRRGDNKIQRFRVRWTNHYVDDSEETPCSCDDEYFRMMSWILNAARCNVEVLHLDIGAGHAIAPMFPSSVFHCGSLTSLSLDLSCAVLTVPCFSFSSNLKYLELKNGIVDEGIFKLISCCCKLIQELIIEEVAVKNITIESSSLEKFSFVDGNSIRTLNISGETLEEILIDWIFHSPKNRSLNISAPGLKYLSWKGDLMNHRNLGSLEVLEEAAIRLKPKVDDFNNVIGVLCSLCRVKVLNLNEATIKGLFREGHIPAPLHNVCDLRMHSGSFVDELVPAMVSLFRGMPNLSTLYVKSKTPVHPQSNASAFDVGYWKMQNLAFIHRLKEVTLELSLGSNGVELARYMLEYGQNLEKMVIIYLPQNLADLTKLDGSKIISNATVLFKENIKEESRKLSW